MQPTLELEKRFAPPQPGQPIEKVDFRRGQ
jgi:hypothetical protein